MAKRVFTCGEVNISHSQMIQLRNEGLLNLGINNDLAAQISDARGTGPKKSTASAAFHLWNWVAVAACVYSIYLSITKAWWWFIPGFIAMNFIWKANKKGNAENLLDAAHFDPEFYERVKKIGGWLYQVEESEVDKVTRP